jgi:cholesterol 7-dehydrogenase
LPHIGLCIGYYLLFILQEKKKSMTSTRNMYLSNLFFKGFSFSLLIAIAAILFTIRERGIDSFAEELNRTPQQLHTMAYMAVGAVFLFLLYKYMSRPQYIRYNPEEQEHIPNGKLLARAARSRKSGKIPPAFPTGWFLVEESQKLSKGEVKYIEFLGEHLVLFRGESGKAAVLDAYCPHLGANLAVEGKVVGDCVECPFHGWQFKQDGKCAVIPYLDKVPEVAKTRAWPVNETNEGIYIWFDALGRLDQINWNLPELTDINEGNWVFHGSFENYVEAHIQEIPENGCDVAHLGVLHVPFILSWLPIFSHKWTANWTAGEAPDDHLAHIALTQTLLIMGKPVPFTTVSSSITQIGPGVVYLSIQSDFGKFIIVEHVTPLQPLYQKVHHAIFGPNNMISRLVAQLFLSSFTTQFNRDVTIWNNKTFVKNPIIVKGDGNILGFRRWYSKFYPSELLEKNQDKSW